MQRVFPVFLVIPVFTIWLSCSNTDSAPAQMADDEVGGEIPQERRKVLVFTKTSGFDHNTREECVNMVMGIAESLDFEVIVSDDSNVFNNQEAINDFNVIFFTNTSGNTLNSEQREIVEAYANQGGNFISNHAASDGYGHSSALTINGGGKGEWDWYAENVTGCSVRNGPNHTASGLEATVTVQNTNARLIMGLQFPWVDREEWYYWEGGYLNSAFTELLRVSDTGSESYDDPRMTSHYFERPDGGISFYTSMGHAKSKYSDEDFVNLMRNVFEFILAD